MPDMIDQVVVFGGSGFLGTRIVEVLSRAGMMVRVAVRHPEGVAAGDVDTSDDRVSLVYADVRDVESVANAVDGCDAIVNSVGLYRERGTETFEAVHERGALNVAHQCADRNVGRLIHISGIGADKPSRSRYVRSRGKGELLVKDAFPPATILRPSVLFGPEDQFVNLLTRIIGSSPIFPLFGRGETKLQPVFAGDVAEATHRALRDPDTQGRIYELGGPQVYGYRQLVELLCDHIKKRRLLVPVPFVIWEAWATLLSVLPRPPVSHDLIALMRRDNMVGDDALSLAELQVEAKSLEDELSQFAF